MIAATLTCGELALLLDALDSHEYWQLSDPYYRESGVVLGEGAEDAEAREEIAAVRALVAKLERMVGEVGV